MPCHTSLTWATDQPRIKRHRKSAVCASCSGDALAFHARAALNLEGDLWIGPLGNRVVWVDRFFALCLRESRLSRFVLLSPCSRSWPVASSTRNFSEVVRSEQGIVLQFTRWMASLRLSCESGPFTLRCDFRPLTAMSASAPLNTVIVRDAGDWWGWITTADVRRRNAGGGAFSSSPVIDAPPTHLRFSFTRHQELWLLFPSFSIANIFVMFSCGSRLTWNRTVFSTWLRTQWPLNHRHVTKLYSTCILYWTCFVHVARSYFIYWRFLHLHVLRWCTVPCALRPCHAQYHFECFMWFQTTQRS